MNIRFDRISIENFRSIQKADVTLCNQGTVIVKGINEYEEKATSNGSGKSSIFEAIVFALFEETSSGEKDVSNRIINKGYTITLYFSVDGDNFTVTRYSSGGKSSVNLYKNNVDISARNKTDTNKLILSILGITKSIFLDSVFLSQNANTNLASLSPTARKERLEILTNTDYTIATFKEELKNVQTRYEADCINIQLEMNKILGKKESLNKQKQDIINKINDIKRENERIAQLGDVKEIEAEINQKGLDIDKLAENISSLDLLIQQEEASISSIRKELDEQLLVRDELSSQKDEKLKEWNSVNSEVGKLKMDITYKNQDIARLNKEIEQIKNSDKCPTCGRKYENANEEHITNIVNEKTNNILAINNQISDLNASITELEHKKDEIKNDGEGLNKQITDINNAMQDIKLRIKVKEEVRQTFVNNRGSKFLEQTNLQKDIDELQSRKDELMKSNISNADEFEMLVVDIDNQLVELDTQYNSQKEIFNQNNEYINVIKNILQLVTKEFRTYLLKNSLLYLNKLLASYSEELFSNSGDIIRIDGDDAKLEIYLGEASYESLSGGERTRVNIALLLAQKSLAEIIGNISCNIIILDEILGYCDSQAENNVVNLITKELDNLESIYMVSHKEIPIGYDTELVVVKDKSGLSKIREY